MRIAPLADVKAKLSAYIEQSETEGPVVITRNGKAGRGLSSNEFWSAVEKQQSRR